MNYFEQLKIVKEDPPNIICLHSVVYWFEKIDFPVIVISPWGLCAANCVNEDKDLWILHLWTEIICRKGEKTY